MEAYQVKLPVFEGPIELLYHLVKKEEINIWDISISRITEGFLDYLRKMQQLDINPAADFLVMAANLLSLKSRMLLPQTAREISLAEEEAMFFGSKEELVQHLLEYGYYKELSLRLKERELERKRIFLRSAGPPKMVVIHRQSSLYPDSSHMLRKTYLNLIQKEKIHINNNEKKEELIPILEEISLIEKIKSVIESIKKISLKKITLEKLLGSKGKRDLVVTFFALLELTRRGKVNLRQSKIFGKIHILITDLKGLSHDSL